MASVARQAGCSCRVRRRQAHTMVATFKCSGVSCMAHILFDCPHCAVQGCCACWLLSPPHEHTFPRDVAAQHAIFVPSLRLSVVHLQLAAPARLQGNPASGWWVVLCTHATGHCTHVCVCGYLRLFGRFPLCGMLLPWWAERLCLQACLTTDPTSPRLALES